MLAVLSRYRILFIVLTLIVLAALIWLVLSVQEGSKVPSKGVYIFRRN